MAEDALLPLSALQHLIFCERQCALIHVEQQWADNRLTVEGSLLHRRVDESGPRFQREGERYVSRGMALRSLELGLVGRADVVEFRPAEDGIRLPDIDGSWQPRPVEYKRGRPKRDDSDRTQLCAQGMCLEEMLGVSIPGGALFYGKKRRRLDVGFERGLRKRVVETARRLHRLIECGRTPAPVFDARCKRCSLRELCLPEAAPRSVDEYLRSML